MREINISVYLNILSNKYELSHCFSLIFVQQNYEVQITHYVIYDRESCIWKFTFWLTYIGQ